jgi:hypothetical protein
MRLALLGISGLLLAVIGPVQVLDAPLPPSGIPRLSRSRASPRLALCVLGLGGTASERITTVELYSLLSSILL